MRQIIGKEICMRVRNATYWDCIRHVTVIRLDMVEYVNILALQ